MAFEDLLRDIRGDRTPTRTAILSESRNKGLRLPGSLSIPARGDSKSEANFILRSTLKNYFMHELPDQIGAPECWQDEFEILIDNLLTCDTFMIQPAKSPRYSWERDSYVQQLGFAKISPDMVERYLLDLAGDNFIFDTDLCDPDRKEMKFSSFVQTFGSLVPAVRQFAGEYFKKTTTQRFSLDPKILVFNLPVEVRALAALALEHDQKKNLYNATLTRDHLTSSSPGARLKCLTEGLNRAVPSLESIIEVARRYGKKELKPLILAYRELVRNYVSVWTQSAEMLSIPLQSRKPKIIGNI